MRFPICVVLIFWLSLPLQSQAQPGSALEFDGGDDYIRSQNNIALDFALLHSECTLVSRAVKVVLIR